jgi:hypothetical protein
MATAQEILDQFVAHKASDDRLTKDEVADIRKKAAKLGDVNTNLSYARMAVAHMKGKFGMVANRDLLLDSSAEGVFRVESEKAKRVRDQALAAAKSPDDVTRAEMAYQAALARAEAQSRRVWDPADQCVYGGLRQTEDWYDIVQNGGVSSLRDIRVFDGLAEQYGCGNCGEVSARTFMFLYNLGIRPLDYMALDGADHAFVVIGRNGRPDNDAVGRNWGKDAAVCDPWAAGVLIPLPPNVEGPLDTFGMAYGAYTANLLEQNMKRIFPTFKGVMWAHREV